ncbi:MAG: hypothetical protein HYV39_02775 [Candidatus Levybacteria bacterium]|nr:hypothetical protein [Candidatus Levybacteria bacterium]
MLKSIPFANAVTTVMAVMYVVCVVLSYAAPDLLFDIFQPWFHTINMQAIKASKMVGPEKLLFGLVTLSAITWVTTFFSIELYNRWAKK